MLIRHARSLPLVALCALALVPSLALADSTNNTFKTLCSEVQTPAEPWQEDPILFPGQSNAGPESEFFGNTHLKPSSTGYQLKVDGNATDTSCADRFDTAAYWVPALYRDGQRVIPAGLDAYYQRIVGLQSSDGATFDSVTEPPTDFRLIAGDATAVSPQPIGQVKWNCEGQPGTQASTPPACGTSRLFGHVVFPGCWDGRSGPQADDAQYFINDGRDPNHCPAGFNHPVTTVLLTIHYDAAASLPDCHQVSQPQPDVNCFVYTLSEYDPAVGQADPNGSIYGYHAAFLNGWNDGPDTIDSPPEDFASLIGRCDNGPDGTPACDVQFSDPTGNAFGS